MPNYTKIVTHPGQAHRDDFVSCRIALALYPIRTIFRRDPTPEEMTDPECLVLDVGGVVDPERGNYDHHQFPRDHQPICALTLFLAGEQLLERFRLMDWVTSTEIMDSKGPFALAQHLGCPPDAIFKNLSPVEGAMIDLFEENKEIDCYLTSRGLLADMMKLLGRSFIAHANDLHNQMEWLLNNSRVASIQGVPALVVESDNTKGTQKYRDQFHPELGICLSWDDRGGGWSLYRFNDDKRVDFSRLKDEPAVLFAHPTGFIAKTKERLPLEEVFALTAKAIL